MSLLVSLLTTSLAPPVSAQEDYTVTIGQDKVFADQPTSLAPPVSAQEEYTVTIGQDKVFTDCNYHYARFDNFPELEHLPWPDPDDREAYSTDNTAYVSLRATPGHAARADSWVGVYFDWDLGTYTWEEVENMPVNVTLDFSYQICGDGYGWDCQSIALVGYPTMWYDYIGSADNPDDVGCRSKTVSETYTTTVGELEGWPGIGYQWIIASCLAYSTKDTCTRYSSAEVQVNSIKIEFLNPQITHFSVSLEYFVGPNEEEWYGQGVMASVYHPEGSDQIESCIASDPSGNELRVNPEWCDNTADYCYFGWFEGGLSNPPPFGSYTITATDKDGCVAEVTSWPTDHISVRVPNITDPINHGYVTTRVPTFRWEPFSDRTTTGYLIELAGPPEETLKDDDVVWRIGLPAGQTEVPFNSDRTAAVPELTFGNTYRLFVFAHEETCDDDEIQCYRDTSIRGIEFTLLRPGDLLLCRTPYSLVPQSYWTHAGIYVGNGWVVEADSQKGVHYTPIESWMPPNKRWVTYLRVRADDQLASKAAEFAEHQLDLKFDQFSIYLDKKQESGQTWYCSELLWAAYLSASDGQINLDGDEQGRVSPDNIYWDNNVYILYEHKIGNEPVTLEQLLLWWKVFSPVDLNIINPDGLILNKQGSEIPGAIYEEIDIDEDGELDDLIAIPEPKMGNYIIQVVPEPDAEDTDTYTLEVTAGETTIVLAEDVQIRNIPSKPYVIESTGTTINAAPLADSNGPYIGNEGSQITFDVSGSYDPDGSIVLYEWDFDNDGIYDATSSTAIFTWGDDHTGTVELRVTDNDGLSGTDTASITVNNIAPTAFFYVEQPEDFILPYHSLTFNGASTDAGWLDTHAATWDFGDGTIVSGTLTEENDQPDATGTTTAEHAYAEPGTYTVRLTVTDDDGGVGDYEEEVTVISAEEAAGMIIDQLEVSIVPVKAPEGVSQKIESAIDKLDQVIDFLDQGKYCNAIGKLDGMITQIEGAIDQVNEQRCSVKECSKGKECNCIADEDANELIESLEQAKQGAIAIRDFISAEHPECA